ncbi:MAG: glycosyltransferase family 39 protein [bacterium]
MYGENEGPQGRDLRSHAAVLLLAVLAAGLVWTATPRGLGLTADSAVYLEAARSLTGGEGLRVHDGRGEQVLLSHFPPGYPIVLATGSLVGLTPSETARSLHALLAGLIPLLFYLLLVRSAVSPPAAAGGTLLLAIFFDVHEQLLMLLSEGLFLALLLTFLLLVTAWTERRSALLLAGLVLTAALAALVRYVGLFLGPALFLVLLLGDEEDPGRLGRAAGAAVLAMAPALFYKLLTVPREAGPHAASLGIHPPTLTDLKDLAYTLAAWFFPRGLPIHLLLAVLLLGAVVAGIVLTRLAFRTAGRPGRDRPSLPLLLFLVGASYVAALLAARTLVYANIPFDERLLRPLYLLGFLAAVWWAERVVRHRVLGEREGVMLLTLLAVLGMLKLGEGIEVVRTAREEGLGLASERIQEAPIMAWLERLPPDLPVLSNAADAVYLATGRPARLLPRAWDVFKDEPLEGGEDEVEQVVDLLRRRGGSLVLLNGTHPRDYLVSPRTLLKRVPPTDRRCFPIGTVYLFRGEQEDRAATAADTVPETGGGPDPH